MSGDLRAKRDFIIDYLSAELMGPAEGEQETLFEDPAIHYMVGTLYPVGSSSSDPEEDPGEGAAASGDFGGQLEGADDEPVVLAGQQLPSALGVSFYLTCSPVLHVSVEAGRYEKLAQSNVTAAPMQSPGKGESSIEVLNDSKEPPLKGSDSVESERKKASPRTLAPQEERKRLVWHRYPLRLEGSEGVVELVPGTDGRTARVQIFGGRAIIRAIWRASGGGWLVTVSVVNGRSWSGTGRLSSEDCLFQVSLAVRTPGGRFIGSYPRVRLLTDDPEEHILDLLYLHARSFALGHGCAAQWEDPVDGFTSEVRSSLLPAVEVRPVVSTSFAELEYILDLFHLAGLNGESNEEIVSGLRSFASRYQDWIEALPHAFRDIPVDLESARNTLMERLRSASDRIASGIALLESDSLAMRAFQLSNQAMLMQMLRGRDLLEINGDSQPGPGQACWRPFQLAFILMTLASLSDANAPERRLVDLIWFPTGGGKTEAYLAAAAYVIFLRRMREPDRGSGTAVLMRYTLRLLTTQQFQRASRLISACELLRRRQPETLGEIPITIGLWVGRAATPNTYAKAREAFDAVRNSPVPETFFQMEQCPWCNQSLLPSRYSDQDEDYGVRARPGSFDLFCPNPECPFHEVIPAGVIDEQLYDHPPSFLLATVDKFASLPWEERAGSFFGARGRFDPPDLIIQDELHLISGPLGTIVGVYEMAVDLLTSWTGRPAKVLASTATIRRAGDQCLGLYARPVAVFPPAGLDARDSFFSHTATDHPGRLYVGVLAPSHTSSTAMVRTSAALLQAPIDLDLRGSDLDAWWTLVAYHNSLRELGKSLTFAADDIPARIRVIAEYEDRQRKLNEDNIVELTSNIDAGRLTGILRRLDTPQGVADEVSILLCTNMLSVGVDVQRLGLMLVNGQPKSTSEYIQATSRVGRGGVPGVIVCLYSPTRPRDRSHYERFTSYHAALYREVEPTSVTPLSDPALNRALHAVLVSVLRNLGTLPADTDAAKFRVDAADVQRMREMIIERTRAMASDEVDRVAEHIDRLLSEWERRARQHRKLEYESLHKAKDVLMLEMNDQTGRVGWPTQRSMRNVDTTCSIRVIGGPS